MTRARPSDTSQLALTPELVRVFSELEASNGSEAVSPGALHSSIGRCLPWFRGFAQQDAHELVRFLLDRVEQEERRVIGPSASSSVQGVFGGSLRSEVSCLTCQRKTVKNDPFLDVSLEIPPLTIRVRRVAAGSSAVDAVRLEAGAPGVAPKRLAVKASPPAPEGVTFADPPVRYTALAKSLGECLHHYVCRERLAVEEWHVCETCTMRQPCTKQLLLERLPRVLCLHLKRFSWNRGSRAKVRTHVQFPLHSLDMAPFTVAGAVAGGKALYDLAGVIVHHGATVGSGHYSAYVCESPGPDPRRAAWRHCNDSTVRSVSASTVANCQAYMLFYVARPSNTGVASEPEQ